jgi:uncharacterized cupredoxin-like copper-binding protein
MPRFRTALFLLVAAALAACSSSSATAPLIRYGGTMPPDSTPSVSVARSQSTSAGDTAGLSEWKVEMASTLKAGKATFTISNTGTIAHELLVFKSDLQPSAYPTNAAGGIIEEGGGVALVSDGDNIDPGGSQSRTIDLVPGSYLFVCNIPGHFKAGMFTFVTVTP